VGAAGQIRRDFAVARLGSNGDLDTGFGNLGNGKRSLSFQNEDSGNGVAIHNVNGEPRIIVAGQSVVPAQPPPPPLPPPFLVGARFRSNAMETDAAVQQFADEFGDSFGHGTFAWDIQVSGCKFYVGGTHTNSLSKGAAILGLIDTDCTASVGGGTGPSTDGVALPAPADAVPKAAVPSAAGHSSSRRVKEGATLVSAEIVREQASPTPAKSRSPRAHLVRLTDDASSFMTPLIEDALKRIEA
jgi:hypothetical protein